MPPVTGQAIAKDAEKYEGKGYVFGGSASKPGIWDCSSFVSYVLGHDLRMALPGGKWGQAGLPPSSHGPVVLSYASWTGAKTISGPPRAGDLCIWAGAGANGHIGIAISADEMVSALNTSQGTVRTPIEGYGPEGVALTYRRVTGVAAGAAFTFTEPMPETSAGSLAGGLVAGVALFAGALVIGLLLVAAIPLVIEAVGAIGVLVAAAAARKAAQAVSG